MTRIFKVALTVLAFVFLASFVTADEETVEDRLKPFGNICLQGEDCGTVAPVAAVATRSGVEVYNAHCFACHSTGVSEAPLVADKAWQWRLEERGEEGLLANTKAGFNVVMPPMGTCMNCTDQELVAAIDYMITGE